MGAVVVLYLISAPFCMCVCANTSGADDTGTPGTFFVTDSGEAELTVHRIAGSPFCLSFVPGEDIALDRGFVPAGSVPCSVSSEDGRWGTVPYWGMYLITDLYADGAVGTFFARFVAEYQVYGILSEEEAVKVSVVWTLEIATIVELKITAEELYS